MGLSKAFWVIVGVCALLAGAIGIFLPLLPTTPFILLAAYAFSKGSPTCHAWLLSHRSFGPMIRDWQENRIIRRRTKILSSVLTATLVAYPAIFLAIPAWTKAVMVLCASGAVLFIWQQKDEK